MTLCDVATANAYFQDERLYGDDWFDFTVVNRTKALAHATSIINNLSFVGSKTVSTQELPFPRGGDTVIPRAIEKATCELAYNLITGYDPQFEMDSVNEFSANFQFLKTQKDTKFAHPGIAHGIPSILAWNLLRPYMTDLQTITIKRIS